jgi:LysM repeat protein
MQEHDTPAKENFVMSGKQNEREESYDYSTAEGGAAKRSMKPIVIAGAVLLGSIIVVLMFLSGSPRSAEKDLLKNMEARLKATEEKLAKLEWIDTGLARLDRKEKEMATMSERMQQLEAAMSKKADQLARETVKPPATAKAAEMMPVPKAEAVAQKPESAKTPATAPGAKADAKTKIHVVQKGETIYAISRKYGVPADQLMKQNKLGPKDPLKPGQQLVIPAKTN